MSCYKALLTENQELQLELLELEVKIRAIRQRLSDKDWISTDELELALDSKTIKLPWD